MSKSHLFDDDVAVEHNLSKADGHVKRAVLDCYKYLCLAYNDKYKEFDKNYENVDLSEIDNGEFLPLLCKKRKAAIQRLTRAKELELSSSGEEILYNAFEEAYNAYADVYNFISDSFENLERLKQKTNIRDSKSKRNFWIGVFVGIVGVLVGIAGIFINLIDF